MYVWPVDDNGAWNPIDREPTVKELQEFLDYLKNPANDGSNIPPRPLQ